VLRKMPYALGPDLFMAWPRRCRHRWGARLGPARLGGWGPLRATRRRGGRVIPGASWWPGVLDLA